MSSPFAPVSGITGGVGSLMKRCSLTQTHAYTLLDGDTWVCRDLLLVLLLIAPTPLPTEPPWGRKGEGVEERKREEEGRQQSQPSALTPDHAHSTPLPTPPPPPHRAPPFSSCCTSQRLPPFSELSGDCLLYSTVKRKPCVCACMHVCVHVLPLSKNKGPAPFIASTVCNHK